jgi:photosystem II stability/assembly factor-like uncharacterized protein
MKDEDDIEWEAIPQITRQSGFSTVDSIGGRPLWLKVMGGRLFRAVEGERRGAMISFSDDDGQSWVPILRDLKRLSDWSLDVGNIILTEAELRRMTERLRELQITDLRVDQKDADVWYGLMESGIAVTRDAGKTWAVSKEGLDIPRIYAIWTPRHVPLVMAGTPAGAYVSNDQGKSWTDTSLILQEDGAIRSEISGAGYLTAYWMGRYHGFISEDEAKRQWWERI